MKQGIYKSTINEYENKLAYKYRFPNANESEFLFSIIIPVYNVEDYIGETIQSVIDQTLDFETHVQIILVNDGSPDNSEEVCLRYSEQYPNNVYYVKKDNGGVSSARNKGIEFVKGKYVNFLDSDDILKEDALEKVYRFFTKNTEKIDVVCLPIYYFEAKKGLHMLSDKFDKTRIIDINETPNKIQLHVSSTFITAEQATLYRFDENLKYGEDAKYINQIILNKEAYGVLSNTKYFYRVRNSQTSAIQNSSSSKAWYNESLVHFSLALIKDALDRWGTVPKYLQHVIMYDLQWKFRVKELPTSVLSEEDQQQFVSLIQDVLFYIDSDVINNQKYINFHLKLFALKLKYLNSEDSLLKKVVLKDSIHLYFNGSLINRLEDQKVYINTMEINNNKILVEGMFASAFDANECQISLLVNDQEYNTVQVDRPLSDVKVWGITVKKIHGFKYEIPINGTRATNDVKFKINVDGTERVLGYKLGKHVKFSKKVPSYYAKDKLIIFPGKEKLVVVPHTFFKRIKKEAGMAKRLYHLSKKKSGAKKGLAVRLLYYAISPLLANQNIYLFMDRIDKADDNAEVLFRHVVNQDDGIKKYFVISKKSSDFERMKKYGKVIPYGTYYHKLMLMFTNKFISSHADEVIINPFQSMKVYYKDLLNYDYVFLQHGVTQNDLSGWLNKYQKNIKLFVCASPYEKNSIVNGKYGYTEKEVKLTGFPRHDRLIDKSNKQIVIMPTWRQNIASKLDNNFQRVYNEGFAHTEYFKMYNSLINDQELIRKAKEKNYSIKFVIHPSLKEQIQDFDEKDDIVEVVNPDDVTYNKLFNESSLMITDYSSVAFDFAYLRKPVIYFQFDQEEFHSGHFSSGYFEYENMGFGPVINTLPEIISEVKNYLDSDCKLPDNYRERIDEFFEHSDQNNSVRVYESIKEIQ
ncbi:bifunctional glycosyltransferase/CDP-glycerol:glycerophosphate glycerophosphotransferase [Halobacillus naozhouensis]|uniref:CDP-glycerol glycerophosphotransferase family protein n=1 Tax=Halobacillus naozhouensis TaxID=554880 RepID=A0ABY8IWY9_9BACI|nr:CDP-glycerol glycerophosphotransferase family protein [Halobacillus naozhouensis]WFT73804.1 CDP-glycerol glycerophosphotransferase family protein [Halobacillus naozhouensis]